MRLEQAAMGLAASAALSLSISTAKADGMPYGGYAPAYNWNGFYVGLNAGGVWGDTRPGLRVDDSSGRYYTFGAGQAANVAAVDAAGRQGVSSDGFTGGGQIGFLWQSGLAVAGLEADIQSFDPRGARTINGHLPALAGQTCANSGGGCAFTITDDTSGDWLTTLRARVGVANDRWLVYGTAGVAWAQLHFSQHYQDTTTPPPQISAGLVSNISEDRERFGFAVGGGLEWAISPRWSLRAEYLYLGFDRLADTTHASPTSGVIPAPGTCPPGNGANGFCSKFNYDISWSESVARLAINYKLDFDRGPVPLK